jgi:hypothetical protein
MDNNEIQSLKNQLAALQVQLNQLEAASEPERASRRNMLRLAGGAAVGAVAGGLAFGAQPANAAGLLADKVEKGIDNAVNSPTILNGAGFTPRDDDGRGILHITDDNTVTPASGPGTTRAGITVSANDIKIGTGISVVASDYGAKLDSPIPLKLMDSSSSVAPTVASGYKGQFKVVGSDLWYAVAGDALENTARWRKIASLHTNLNRESAPPQTLSTAASRGDLVLDSNGDFWLCTDAGTPGTWTQLGAPINPQFVAIDPIRAYDSRKAAYTTNGVMAPNSSRVISVADAHDSEGAVTTANAVPNGATAVAFNITATGANGGNFFSVNPGDAASFTASTVNFAAGLDIANASVVKLDSSRQIKVFCGGDVGSAHVIIDIVGYYQ